MSAPSLVPCTPADHVAVSDTQPADAVSVTLHRCLVAHMVTLMSVPIGFDSITVPALMQRLPPLPVRLTRRQPAPVMQTLTHLTFLVMLCCPTQPSPMLRLPDPSSFSSFLQICPAPCLCRSLCSIPKPHPLLCAICMGPDLHHLLLLCHLAWLSAALPSPLSKKYVHWL